MEDADMSCRACFLNYISCFPDTSQPPQLPMFHSQEVSPRLTLLALELCLTLLILGHLWLGLHRQGMDR